MAKETTLKALVPDDSRMQDIIKRAINNQSLKSGELKEFRDLIAETPALDYLNLPSMALDTSLDIVPDRVTREVWRAELARIKASLGYVASPQLERLLIDQVCMCHLRMWFAEYRQGRHDKEGATLKDATYDQKALTMTQARYLRAIETLAKVRRLKLPALQVNVAEAGAKQMNIATT